MRAKPWDVSDALWGRIEPLLPKRERRFRYPGRKPFDARRLAVGKTQVSRRSPFGEHSPTPCQARAAG